MANCDVSTLLDQSDCFACLPAEQLDVLELQLLCNIYQGVTVCNVQTLLNSAQCFAGLPPMQRQILKLALLCQIAQSGGGGGGGNQYVYQGNDDPPIIVPNDPTKPAIYFKNGGGPMYEWDVPSQTWK